MRLMIYAFLNQKGGVGKTTLSIHTAAELSRRVLLFDAEPQGSALAWSNCRDEPLFSVVGMPKATLHKKMDLLIADNDEVVIDGPPRVTDLARSIILAADVVVIPLQPSCSWHLRLPFAAPRVTCCCRKLVDDLYAAASRNTGNRIRTGCESIATLGFQ